MKLVTIAIVPFSFGWVSCSTMVGDPVSRERIVESAKREVARREAYPENPYVSARQQEAGQRTSWIVYVNVLDRETPTECGCVPFKPDHERILTYSRSGKLLKYQAPD